METVSYYTAQKLKSSGFPQPQPANGQTWYTNPIQPVKIGGSTGKKGEVWVTTASSNWPVKPKVLKSSSAFAPGREELLRAINSLLPAGVSHAVTQVTPVEELAEVWINLKERTGRAGA